jgi:DNA-binding response OmpR family regulator
MLLKAMGHEVERAYDGEQAVALARESRPELVLLDIGMPRMDGYETCRRMRSEPWGEAICVVALTGWGQERDRRKSRAAGFDHHLVKPVDIEELSALIDSMDSIRVPHPDGSGVAEPPGRHVDRARPSAPREGSPRESFPGDARNRQVRRSSDTTPTP